MNVDIAVFLWGVLVTIILLIGIVTGEWQEKLSDPRRDRDDAAA